MRTPDGRSRATYMTASPMNLTTRPWCSAMTSNAAASNASTTSARSSTSIRRVILANPAMSTKPTVVADGP